MVCACCFSINIRGIVLIFIDPSIDSKLLTPSLNSEEDAIIYALAMNMMIYNSSILKNR